MAANVEGDVAPASAPAAATPEPEAPDVAHDAPTPLPADESPRDDQEALTAEPDADAPSPQASESEDAAEPEASPIDTPAAAPPPLLHGLTSAFVAPANENGAATTPDAPLPPRPADSAENAASNVVPLRPGAPRGERRARAKTPPLRPTSATPSAKLPACWGRAFRRTGARTTPSTPRRPRRAAKRANPGDLVALIDRLPIGVMVFRDAKTLFANRTLLDLLGHSDLAALQAAGEGDRLFASPGGESSAKGDALKLRGKDGAEIPVDARAIAISWAGGPAVMVALRRGLDLEARTAIAKVEAERQARDDDSRTAEALMQGSESGFLRLDAAGHIVWANAAAESLLGRRIGAGPQTALAALLPENASQAASAALDDLQQADAPASRVDINYDSQGPKRLSLIRLGDRATGAVGALIEDLAPERERTATLESERAEALRASQLKSETLARISHEIRTPLHAILGFVEVMMEQRFGPIGNERYREYLRDIHASGQHVVSLANDLLDIAKIESGKLDLNFGPVDANRVIRDCLALLQPQAAQEHVIVRTSLHEELPRVLADERALRQIILNLVSNAVKFNAPGGQVIVSTDLGEAGQALIRVRDTGLGMDEKELSDAMLPFTQLGPKKQGGTGLGLPLTKALAEANHARFVIHSEKRQGTLVELTFPVAQAAQ